MNIRDRQAAARSGYDYAVFHVVTWTVNQSGLVTLIFDLLTLKLVSESRVFNAPVEGVPLDLGIGTRGQKSSNNGATGVEKVLR